MLAGAAVLGGFDWWIPPVVANTGWKKEALRACRYGFSQLHHF